MKTNDFQLTVAMQQRSRFPMLPDRRVMLRWMRAALERDAELTVRFVDLDEGRTLNHQFRGRDYPTNVLTFDYAKEPVVMADIVICVPVLERESAEQGKTFREHLAHLLVHGVLHAHGYDHLEEAEAEKMEALETRILTTLGFPNPYSDQVGMVHD